MENQQEEGTFPTNMEEDVSISKRKKKCPENMWNYLPRDVGRIVCMLLGDVDMLGYLLFIAKEWVIFGDEQIYRDVATRVYISQTGRQLLNVQRPRIRTNGFYSLRTSYWKPPCNDAFWEEKKREYTEVKFFRHFRFYNDSTCLYALNNTPPRDMRQMLASETPVHKKLFRGCYVVQRDMVTVHVSTHYCHLRFRLKIQHLCGDEEGGNDRDYNGLHNSLKITEHSTAPLHQHQQHLAPEQHEQHREWLFHDRTNETEGVVDPARLGGAKQ